MPSEPQVQAAQLAECKRAKKRLTLRELPLMARKVVPAELAQVGDVKQVAEAWRAQADAVRDAAIIDLLRRVDRLEQRRVLAILGRAA